MIVFYFNVPEGRFVSQSGETVLNLLPVLTYGDQVLWRIFPRVSDAEAMDLTAVRSFKAAVAQDFDSTTAPLMRLTGTGIAVSPDGAAIDVRMDARSTSFLSAVDGKEKLPSYFELCGYDDSGARVLYLSFRVVCKMVLDPDEETAALELPELAASQAYVNAVVCRTLIYEYSTDGESWHDVLTSGDLYFRVRHGESGVASSAQNIPFGPEGEKGDKGDKGDDGARGAHPLRAAKSFAHPTYGAVGYLDSANSVSDTEYHVSPVELIQLAVVSANPEITGNAVLTVSGNTFTVPVGSEVEIVGMTLSVPASGIVTIARDTANVADTLNDGTDPITVLVVNGEID